jgi:hypothetical protein
MNAVGIFAGRGDVIVAMALALLIGVWAGWQIRRLTDWVNSKTSRKSTKE